jgi:hypothetical protein
MTPEELKILQNTKKNGMQRMGRPRMSADGTERQTFTACISNINSNWVASQIQKTGDTAKGAKGRWLDKLFDGIRSKF